MQSSLGIPVLSFKLSVQNPGIMELVKYETDEHALCKYETDEHALSEILSREKKMEQRRKDQELHAHKNIWTKEAHGGRYINVRGSPTLHQGTQCKHHRWLSCGDAPADSC